MKIHKKTLFLGVFPPAFAFAVHCVVYTVPKLFNLHYFYLPDSWLLYDNAIPVIPAFILVYYGCFLQWAIYYFSFCRENAPGKYEYLTAEILVRFVSLLAFLFFPVTIARPEVSGSDLFSRALRLLYRVDTPTSLCPSLHCVQSWMCMRYALKYYRHRSTRLLSVAVSLLVFTSTLVLKQHLLIDVVSAIALSEIALAMVRIPALPALLQRWTQKLADSIPEV